MCVEALKIVIFLFHLRIERDLGTNFIEREL